jgi:heat shock protein HslJ
MLIAAFASGGDDVTRFGTWWLMLLMAMAWVVGCGSDDGNDVAGTLAGREFLLDGSEGFEAVPGTTLRVSFSEGEQGDVFGFSAGCNSHSGSYRIRDGALLLSNVTSTLIGCPQNLAQQDHTLSEFFGSQPMVILDGDRLTLTSGDVVLEFVDREVADPDRPLSGPTWVVDTFIDGPATSNLALSQSPTLLFDGDGSVDIDTGCNTGRGTWNLEGDQLTLAGMNYTEIGCAEPNAATAEASVQAVMTDGMVTVEIEAARLTLMRGELGLSASARNQDQ